MLFGPLILFFKANFVFPTLLDIYQIFKAQYMIFFINGVIHNTKIDETKTQWK